MNNNKNFNEQQINNLLSETSRVSGVDKNTIQSAAQDGNIDKMLSKLSPAQAKSLQKILSDKNATKELLSTPQAQKLLMKILGEKK
jgi:hypothetical protein